MRNIFLIRTVRIYALLALTTVMFGSLPSHAEEFVYELDTVRDVDVSTGIDLDLRCGNTNSLRLEAGSEDAFEFSNREGSLRLSRAGQGWSSSSYDWAGPIAAQMVVRSLPKSFAVSSGGSVSLADDVIVRELIVGISSGAFVDACGASEAVSGRISSGARLTVGTDAEIQGLESSSGAHVRTDC